MASKRLYVLGVDSGREPPRVNHVYDPENDSWTAGATVLTNQKDFACAVVNDELYTVGGYTFDDNPNSGHVTVSAVNERYTPFGYGTPDPSYVPPDTVAPEVLVISPTNITYDGEVPLNFTVNEEVCGMDYSLDGQDLVPITGNTTLTGLSRGLHNITVYAEDEAGNIGTTTATFTVGKTEIPLTLIVVASGASLAAIAIALFAYFKKGKNNQGG
jgi:hypothetical protein